MIDTIAPKRLALLEDQLLTLDYDAGSGTQTQAWIPLHASPETRMGRAHIRVLRSDADGDDIVTHHGTAIMLGAVTGMVADHRAELDDPSGMRIAIDLAQLRSVVSVPGDRSDVQSALTLSSAFLIGRMGGALLHAAAAADESGRAWIIAGDTHSGKTTTCAALVAGGWRFLADDEIVLRRPVGGGLQVDGWPRVTHLDDGVEGAILSESRASRDVRARWPGEWIRSAPLGGVILPTIQRGTTTQMRRTSPPDALAGMMRQSPWLTADREIADDVLALLSEAARLPCYALILGRDSYREPGALHEVIGHTLRDV